jgi:Flp pilus assembly protein CpaB
VDLRTRLLGRPGWRRALRLRRLAAGALVVAALVLALTPEPGTAQVAVVVAAADLRSGSTVDAGAVEVRRYPAALAPAGALAAPDGAVGRVLIGPARAGEPLTDVRLTGSSPVDGDAAAVPVRLADPGVAALLRPGGRVDVVTLGEQAGEAVVLAPDAEVITVLAADGDDGPLVLVALPRPSAARVAAALLADQVAVTLRA